MSETAKQMMQIIKTLPIEDVSYIQLETKNFLADYVAKYYASVSMPKLMNNLNLWQKVLQVEWNGEQIETIKFRNSPYAFYAKYRDGRLFGFEVYHPNIMDQAAVIRCKPDSKSYMRYVLMRIFGKDDVEMEDDTRESPNSVSFGENPTKFMKMPSSIDPITCNDPLFFGKREEMYKQFVDYFTTEDEKKETFYAQEPHFCSLANVNGKCVICKKNITIQ